MLLQMVYVYDFLTKSNILVLLNASLKDDNDIPRQVKSLHCTANKLRGTFAQCSNAVKNFRLCMEDKALTA